MKSKKFFLLPFLFLLCFLFCIEGCSNIFSMEELKTSISLKLDLSSIVKGYRSVSNSRDLGGVEYVLKVVAYNGENYSANEKIENLPIFAQSSNKVETSGIVQTTLKVPVDSRVIFEAKLVMRNTVTNEESQDALYYGKSDVINIKQTDNKVSIILKKTQLGEDLNISLKNEFLVQFNTFDGSIVDDQKVEKYKTATAPASPTKTGYTFDGWYTSSDEGTILEKEFDFTTPITSDITLYAKWTANKSIITITLPNTNDPEINLQQSTNGDEVTFTAKEGFATYAWYIDGEIQANATESTFIVDTSSMEDANYKVMIIVTDSDGNYYSATADLELKK